MPRRGKPLRLEELAFPSLTEPRARTLDALVAVCAGDSGSGHDEAARLLGLGPTQVDEVRRNAGLREAPTARADQVYSGVLYEALDLATLPASARRRAASRVAITSALFGLLRPGDRIPSYRLSGSVSLPGLGQVSTWWRDHLDPVVRAASGRGLVVDLRSTAYASFWRPAPDTAERVAAVRVLHEVDGRRKVVSHFNKATKGRLVRSLLENGATPRTPAAFADHLVALGWKAELGRPGRHGTPLDVVVTEL